jgi:hypothetical protein
LASDLQHARGDDLDLFVGQGLQDGEQQVLLAQVAGVLDVQTLGEGDQVFRRLLVQFLQGDAAVGDDRLAVLVLIVGRGVDAGVIVDDFGGDFDLDFGFRRGLDGGARSTQGQGLAWTFRNNFNDFRGLVVVFRGVGHGVLAHALGREEASRAVSSVDVAALRPEGGRRAPAGSIRQASQEERDRPADHNGITPNGSLSAEPRMTGRRQARPFFLAAVKRLRLDCFAPPYGFRPDAAWRFARSSSKRPRRER